MRPDNNEYRIISYSEIATTRSEEVYTSASSMMYWFRESVKTWERLGDPEMLFWIRATINGRIVESFANVPERHTIEYYQANNA